MPLAENAVYFFHFVALCLVWPYLPLFLSRYVSEAELGLLLGATRLVGVAASPAWAWLADAKCGRGPIFALSWLCWQLLTPLVLVAARTPFLALVLLARSVFEAPLIPFVDAGVVARASFGAARLYGSLSWGLTAPVAGYVYANYGFAPCVAAAAFFACGAAVFAVDVVPAAKTKRDYDQVHRPSVTTRVLNPFSIADSDEGGAPPAADVNPFEIGGLESDDEEAKAEPPHGKNINPFEIGADSDDDEARTAQVEGDLGAFLAAAACVGSGALRGVRTSRRCGDAMRVCRVAAMAYGWRQTPSTRHRTRDRQSTDARVHTQASASS